MEAILEYILDRITWLVPLLLSLSVHEWAHAWAASQLGDQTAARRGRLTVDPLAHIDPVGTFLLPMLGVPFGWAKPVPVQPNNFRADVSLRMGMLWTAAAGPLSNLVLGLASGLAYGLAVRSGFSGGLTEALYTMAMLNALLAVFNLVPVPPLDGSRIFDGLCPARLRPAWDRVQALGPLLLVGVVAVPFVLGMSPFTPVLHVVAGWLTVVAGG